MSIIRSRENARVRRWRKLAGSRRARRTAQGTLIDGVRLVAAYLAAGGEPRTLIASESGVARADIAALIARCGEPPVVLSDALFGALAATQTPTGIAAEIAIPAERPELHNAAACVFLERVQDARNVGAILRSAAAFGVRDAVLGTGCADAWSPKALRAGMGAQFALRVEDGVDLPHAVARFAGTLVCAVVRGGEPIERVDLRGRVGWIFGGEGQGVSAALAARAALRVTIPMPGGAESLNVAAAAAILFYERARQLSRPAAPG
jgi:TrmH family RNA methyltransferase